MKEKILTNVRIIDPSQKMNEIGDIIINDKGKIKSIGKGTKNSDMTKSAEKIDAVTPEVAGKTFGADAESEAEVQDAVDDNAAHISGEVAAEKASADQ